VQVRILLVALYFVQRSFVPFYDFQKDLSIANKTEKDVLQILCIKHGFYQIGEMNKSNKWDFVVKKK
jgi:hypothetical protein